MDTVDYGLKSADQMALVETWIVQLVRWEQMVARQEANVHGMASHYVDSAMQIIEQGKDMLAKAVAELERGDAP